MSNDTTNNHFTEEQKSRFELRFDELRADEEHLTPGVKRYGYNSIDECACVDPISQNLEQEDVSEFIDLQRQCRQLIQQKKDLERTIHIEPAKINQNIEAAERILIASRECGVYQRSGKLVRLLTFASLQQRRSATSQSSPTMVAIDELNQVALSLILSGISIFEVCDARSGVTKKIDCPERLAKYLIEKGSWKLPILTGIIHAPTLREDGSILDDLGYDELSGMLFVSGGCDFEEVPEFPTKDDALKALTKIKHILQEFPFDNEVSMSVAIAAILTALIRKSLRTAPLFGLSAPKMATGKSLLADIISLIATGEVNSVVPQAENEAEEKKRILALLMEGAPIICFDNIDKPFGSSALCAVLTQCEYKDRKLGVSETRNVPTNATFLATGNNLTFFGDMSTRVLLIKLDAQEERPEERVFALNLHTYIPEHRAELVNAGLTILRAHHVAGRPKQDVTPFGRFEEWGAWVRESLLWLGIADPCASRKEVEVEDPIRMALGSLFYGWHIIFRSIPVKVKQIVYEAMQENVHEDDERREARELLKDAIFELAGDNRGGINQRVLAKKLSAFKHRIEGGYRLEQAGVSQGTTLWALKKIEKNT
jgi:putative DNA primase/helicase